MTNKIKGNGIKMEYYSRYVEYNYRNDDQSLKVPFNEKSVEDKLEEEEFHKKFRLSLLDKIDSAKLTKATAIKSRNAYLSDAILRAGSVLGPPIAGITGASIWGDERYVAASIGFGVIYAGIVKLVAWAMVDPDYGPKAGVCWTLANVIPYYNKIVKTNGKFINTMENKIKEYYKKRAEGKYNDPNEKGFGP